MCVYMHDPYTYLHTNVSILFSFVSNASFYFKKSCMFLLVICFVVRGWKPEPCILQKNILPLSYTPSPKNNKIKIKCCVLPGVVVHSFTSRSLEAKEADLCEFKAILVYIVSSNPGMGHSATLVPGPSSPL